MGSAFNPQILVEKLAKLNNTQQSIETLSHWCIFHMNKAKHVVETWDRQYHRSPREQRLAYLYLANDILQNSRRKGTEFVAEFWKVLPDALRDVIVNGDEFGRNSAIRLISIWDDRKVFGSRGHILKEEFVGRQADSSNRIEKHAGFKLRPTAGNVLDKIVSGYQIVYGGDLDEDVLLNRCRSTISCIEKVDREIGDDLRSGHVNGPGIVDELKGHHAVLDDCIEQLTAIETSRVNLVSLLREAMKEQEVKLDQLRSKLQDAQSRSEQAGNICRLLLNGSNNSETSTDKNQNGMHMSSGSGEQSAPVMYSKQMSFSETSSTVEGDPKSAAAAVAEKLTASTSSAQMLSYVLSSLASEGVIGNTLKESSNEYPTEKRAKTGNDHPSYVPQHNPQAGAQKNLPATSQEPGVINEPPPLPSSPPPMPPLPPMQPYALPPYMHTAGDIPSGAYGYGAIAQQPAAPLPSYPQLGCPMNGVSPYTAAQANAFQSTEGGFYSQPSTLPMAPISRQ